MPPPAFEEIRAVLLEQQAKHEDADYIFEIPIQLARSVCGFVLSEGDWPAFNELQHKKVQKTPKIGFEASVWLATNRFREGSQREFGLPIPGSL